MPVTINSISYSNGTLSLSSLNTETTVFSYSGGQTDAIIEGWISLQNMQSGDITIVTVYVTVDGTNYYVFLQRTFAGPVNSPILRIHTLQIPPNMGIKVTINQISGTARSYPYYFITQVLSS